MSKTTKHSSHYIEEPSPMFNSPVKTNMSEEDMKYARFIKIIRENKLNKRNITQVDLFLQSKLAVSIADIKEKCANPTLRSIIDFVTSNYYNADDIKKLRDYVEHNRDDRKKALSEAKLYGNLAKIKRDICNSYQQLKFNPN